MPNMAIRPMDARVYRRRLQEEPPERVADAEEHQNHRGNHHGNQADHRAEAWAVAVHRAESYVGRPQSPTAALKGWVDRPARVLSKLSAIYADNRDKSPPQCRCLSTDPASKRVRRSSGNSSSESSTTSARPSSSRACVLGSATAA